MGDLERTFRAFLSDAGGGNSGYLVLGDYGSGKSHALTRIRDLSHDSGYTTCSLTADGFQCALNHPQRFLAHLLQTMSTSTGDSGYASYLTRLLEVPDKRDEVVRIVMTELSGSTRIEEETRHFALNLQHLAARSTAGVDAHEIDRLNDQFIRVMGGEQLVHLSGLSSYMNVAYRFLSLACKIVSLDRQNGLVIIIDEVESIFTKLPNIRSRAGAIRTLAALIGALPAPRPKVVMALTPDAERLFRMELADIARLASDGPVARLHRCFAADSIPMWRCRSLNGDRLLALAEQIRVLFADAYPGVQPPAAGTWMALLNSIASSRQPTRLLVREIIDCLDRARFQLV